LSEDHSPNVLNHEQINAMPMGVDDAVMQLELNESQNVFFFTNQETDTLNALYRRPDGALSWIEPEAQ
ncbi:MAG: sigma 54 modulation/S30EA ribosomal C-terminal domain-containing protein, partial [Mariprofundaceae bacterium]